MIDLLVLDQVQEGVNLLDSSCVLFQILIMFPTTKLVDWLRVADLPSGKYLGVELGPVGDHPVNFVMCPCGTFRTEVLETTKSYQ